MRAKTILTVLFLISLAVAVVVVLRALPTQGDANTNMPKEEILAATVPLAAGTLLRAQDVTWQTVARSVEPGEIVRPSEGGTNPAEVDRLGDVAQLARRPHQIADVPAVAAGQQGDSHAS